jgi:heat shock protein 5
MADQEGMGGKISADDKKTILAAIKEKNDWMEEHRDAEAEDYEEQLSEFQATVAVSFLLRRPLS